MKESINHRKNGLQINLEQLQELMRLQPTLEDTAAFFKCSQKSIERTIKKNWGINFVQFRKENMVHTRLAIVRKMVQKALAGDNSMLIWVSKNMLDWKDKKETIADVTNKIVIDKTDEDL